MCLQNVSFLNNTTMNTEFDDLLDAFNDNLSKYPNNNLVSMNDKVYTYGEGAFIAHRIAQKLKELDVKVHDHVSFLVERSELYMFSILGILSTGAVYVPLDDNLPDERLKFILDDTKPKVAIVSDETYERAKSLNEDITILNVSDIIKGEINHNESVLNYSDNGFII